MDYKPELRSEPRVPVDFHGELILDDSSIPCAIQNMCSRGFLIKYTKDLPHYRDLPVGQVLRLRCELFPAKTLECTVEVRHINAACFGARVIQMSEEGKRLCLQFLEEQRVANLKIIPLR